MDGIEKRDPDEMFSAAYQYINCTNNMHHCHLNAQNRHPEEQIAENNALLTRLKKNTSVLYAREKERGG